MQFPTVLSVIRVVLPVCAVTWAALLAAAPWLGLSGSSRPAVVLSASTYLAGSLVCHQQPGRSFLVAGAHLPVCARCAGIYFSTAAGVLLGAWYLLSARERMRPTATDWRSWLLVGAAPTVLTLIVEWLGLAKPPGVVRALAAIPLGLVAGAAMTVGLSFGGKLRGCEPRQ